MPHPVLTSLKEAQDRLFHAAHQVSRPQAVRCGLADALGAVCAEDVTAPHALPPADCAAVDGYAVYTSDLDTPEALPIIGTARAGHPYAGQVSPGQALRIFTGAVMPHGPDCILMHEDCHEKDGQVTTELRLRAGMNIRPRGENLKQGEVLVRDGQFLSAADIGQLAAGGIGSLEVYGRKKVALISMGDELVQPGHELSDGQIYDSNRPMLSALLKSHPVIVDEGGAIDDNPERLTAAFSEALSANDVLISTGGASDGIEDHTQAALQALGAEVLFWRLALKPGRPACVAQLGEKLIFCLPGNPVAVYVCFMHLVRPALDIIGGGRPRMMKAVCLPSGFDYQKKPGRAEYIRAILDTDRSGRSIVMPYGRKGAGVISSLTGADGVVEIPEQADKIATGQLVNFLFFRD